ncbi:hypothetical protein PG994_003301 [Apiospora phragmitis]|uniref:Uncharacterized protein n=1 Tax=Apiospora phragmitis TaxID=2905665 RepID=A0ABR1VXS0_9PEZI
MGGRFVWSHVPSEFSNVPSCLHCITGILAAVNVPIACRAASPSLRIATGNIHCVATLHETNEQPRSTRRSAVVLTLSKTVANAPNVIFIGRQERLQAN